jgi:hypothetical protein
MVVQGKPIQIIIGGNPDQTTIRGDLREIRIRNELDKSSASDHPNEGDVRDSTAMLRNCSSWTKSISSRVLIVFNGVISYMMTRSVWFVL